MKKNLVSNKEFEVLSILWENETGLTAKQIHEINPDLVLSTVQSVLKKLVKKDLLKVDEIVYSGTVLTRSYIPTLNKENFILKQFEELDMPELLTQFLGNSNNTSKTLEEIENVIAAKRRGMYL